LFVTSPIAVAVFLLLNAVPSETVRAERFRVLMEGRLCMGGRIPYCRPVVVLEDEAYAEWPRVRWYHTSIPKDLRFVEYRTAVGLFGFQVVYSRSEYNKEGTEV
jgi:hypothetical protein